MRTYAKMQCIRGNILRQSCGLVIIRPGIPLKRLQSGAEGIKRIAVMRADVDNLGQTFVSGFSQGKSTLSRTATLSRQLSVFFKHYIRDILENGEYSIQEKIQNENAK